MGQVASTGIPNTGYHTQTGPISRIDVSPQPVAPIYDSSKTYVAFVVGDGDNLWHLKYKFVDFFKERIDYCADNPDCYPMTWTMSPEAARQMPDIVRHHASQMISTGSDYWTLPPSGSLYSYPSMMSAAGQTAYIEETQRDMNMYSTRCSVHWEWFYSWRAALHGYFPRWGEFASDPRGFVLTNVPYMFPMWIFSGEDFRVVGDSVFLFKPNEWRHSSATPGEMADSLNGLPGGYITPVYTTYDGSLDPIANTIDLVDNLLGEHVVVVSLENLLDLAVQKHAGK